MEEKKFRCPQCMSVLKVKNSHNEDVKTIVCPVCSTSLTVTFHCDKADGHTILPDQCHLMKKAYLRHHGVNYELSMGQNVVGRKAITSEANIQIETEDMMMSRQHAEIICGFNDAGQLVCTLSNKNGKNGTTVNSIRLKDGDKVVLEDSNVLMLGNTTISFHMTE